MTEYGLDAIATNERRPTHRAPDKTILTIAERETVLALMDLLWSPVNIGGQAQEDADFDSSR